MNPERLISLCSEKGVNWKAVSPATGGDTWSAEDAALACGPYRARSGRIIYLEKPAELAFRYRWARDIQSFPQLKAYLLMEAVALKEREHWPDKVKRLKLEGETEEPGRYLEDLTELALYEEHFWYVLKQFDLWSVYMRVQPIVWNRQLAKPYEALRYIVNSWCGEAHSHMRRNLRRETLA